MSVSSIQLIPLLVLVTCVSAASVRTSDAQRSSPALSEPSDFDYVVLAGIADSSYPLGMSGYHL